MKNGKITYSTNMWRRKVLIRVWGMYVHGVAIYDIAAWTGLSPDAVEEIIDSIVI